MFFDGKVSSGRNVSLSGKKVKNDTKDLVEKARKEREQRELIKQRNQAAIILQCRMRRYLTIRKYCRLFLQEFDKNIENISKIKNVFKLQGKTFNIPVNTVSSLLSYITYRNQIVDNQRLVLIQQLLIESLSSRDFNYLSNCSDEIYKDAFTYRFLKILQLTVIRLASSADFLHPAAIDIPVRLLQLSLLSETKVAASTKLLEEIIDDAAYGLRLILKKSQLSATANQESAKICAFLAEIIKAAFLSMSSSTHKALKFVFLHLFTLPNVLSHTELDSLFTVLISVDFNFQEMAGNPLTSVTSKYSSNQGSQDKLNYLSNFSLLLLRKKSKISSTSSESSESLIFKSDWMRLIEDILFNFTSVSQKHSSANGGIETNKNNYYPFVTALRYLEYRTNVALHSLPIKMEVDNDESSEKIDLALESSIGNPMSDAVLTELISDYILLDGIKKLELHNNFLIHSLQIQEALLAEHRNVSLTAINNAIIPILQVLTNNDFLLNMIENIYPINVSLEGTNHPTIKNMFTILRVYTVLLSSYSIELPEHYETQNLNSVTSQYSNLKFALLNTLAFSHGDHSFVLRLWSLITGPFTSFITKFINLSEETFLRDEEIRKFSTLLQISTPTLYQSVSALLYLFAQTFYHQLSAVDDEELLKPNHKQHQSERNVFPVSELPLLMTLLKQLMWKFYWNEPILDANITTTFMHPKKSLLSYEILIKYSTLTALTSLFNHLCIRNERRNFLTVSDWQWLPLQANDFALIDPNSDVYSSRDRRHKSQDENGDNHYDLIAEGDFFIRNSNVKMVLLFIPQVIPFKQRVALFQSLVEYDKINYFNSLGSGINPFAMGLGIQYNIQANIRRDHLVEDAIKDLNNIPGYKLKGKVQIEFVSEQGYQEAGIDGGGIFKEFMDSFAKAVFDPAFGLFISTSDQLLTVNPGSNIALGEGYLNLYYFVGKMLGKALYEKLLFQSEFALGFLNVLLGRVNEFDDLYNYDEQVYRSLMDLKRRASQGEDISALDIYFEVSKQIYDKVYSQELIPNGSQTKVTNENILQYIHRYAHYQQNVSISAQCKALLKGFRELVPVPWIRMFNTRELQLLINGETRKIDLNDLKLNTSYASGYHESQPYIQGFWQIIDEMTLDDQKNFLKFVTSCVRQPLLGFKELHPKFCIQKVSQYTNIPLGSDHPGNPQTVGAVPRLPSAATCMNLLKLPQYGSIEILKEKLLYSIRSNSGFELS